MRLEVTRQADLAVRALVTLGRAQKRITARALAQELETSRGFMSQVMNPLTKAGYVSSLTGRSGGYQTERDLAEITLLEVIELIDGPIDDGICVVVSVPCDSHEHCPMHASWNPARKLLIQHLQKRTLDGIRLGYWGRGSQ